ncbi:MAG TPA: fumarylacetoacetate hydrolase family protein [Phycisphaerales bacterium]|nr:fumarylacetoacetate hydrolase family protein [Phycisphaerales bacterium]
MHFTRTLDGVALIDGARTLPVRHIIGIGRNYAEHAKEQGAEIPTRPMLFAKNPASLCLSGDAIVIPRACQDRPQVDFEGELGVLVGPEPVKDVPAERALSCVAAYCVANDVSARWWQKEGGGGQFYRGKSFDTFCPVGAPVPASSVRDPQALRLTTRLNGETMQNGTTADMVFSVATLIAEISRGHTIVPGTLILTGTPSGVGFARNPPVWLNAGDTVEIEVEGVGKLVNTVRAE